MFHKILLTQIWQLIYQISVTSTFPLIARLTCLWAKVQCWPYCNVYSSLIIRDLIIEIHKSCHKDSQHRLLLFSRGISLLNDDIYTHLAKLRFYFLSLVICVYSNILLNNHSPLKASFGGLNSWMFPEVSSVMQLLNLLCSCYKQHFHWRCSEFEHPTFRLNLSSQLSVLNYKYYHNSSEEF